MTDDGEPNNKALRYARRGLGQGGAADVSYYFYAWYLAELSGPNPMITKWSHDIPYVYEKGNCRYWQPETISNFETLHARPLPRHAPGLGPRRRSRQDIIDELHAKFYGAAAKEMAAYWHFIDDVWVKTPEYAGCGFGHLRRWTRANMAKARTLMDAADKAAKTDIEKQRVEMAERVAGAVRASS